jgi:hypothetical protein
LIVDARKRCRNWREFHGRGRRRRKQARQLIVDGRIGLRRSNDRNSPCATGVKRLGSVRISSGEPIAEALVVNQTIGDQVNAAVVVSPLNDPAAFFDGKILDFGEE